MGLLDDAIREHLDLKRRRGADPSEIQRAEREALGPVRREPEPIQPAGFEDDLEPDYGDEPHFAPEPAYEAREDEPLYEDELAAPFDVPPPGSLPPEPEPPLPHGAVGTGPGLPAHDEPLEEHENDPWVSDSAAPAAPPPRFAEPEPVDEPEPPVRRRDPLPDPEPPPGGVDQETVEYRIEHHEDEPRERPPHEDERRGRPPHQDEPQGEDMLEETPEFLQDTPDHDRLWFEQRPPRDFDFDK